MILLDSDVMIDLLRGYPPARQWFDSLPDDEILALSGFVVFELIQGCQNKAQQDKLQRQVTAYEILWLSPADCEKALEILSRSHAPALEREDNVKSYCQTVN
jgi:hypothetical protein